MITGKVTILRLATGEDIIGTVAEDAEGYQIISPFKVIFRRLRPNMVGLTIYMGKIQVQCTMIPKSEFVDYYHRVSDELYMRLIEHDGIYREQLSQLDKAPTMFDEAAGFGMPPFSPEDIEHESDESSDDGDEPPTTWN